MSQDEGRGQDVPTDRLEEASMAGMELGQCQVCGQAQHQQGVVGAERRLAKVEAQVRTAVLVVNGLATG